MYVFGKLEVCVLDNNSLVCIRSFPAFFQLFLGFFSGYLQLKKLKLFKQKNCKTLFPLDTQDNPLDLNPRSIKQTYKYVHYELCNDIFVLTFTQQ